MKGPCTLHCGGHQDRLEGGKEQPQAPGCPKAFGERLWFFWRLSKEAKVPDCSEGGRDEVEAPRSPRAGRAPPLPCSGNC